VICMAASLVPVLLVFTIATFPGEWLEKQVPTIRLVPNHGGMAIAQCGSHSEGRVRLGDTA
jgi:hypothetical protein